MGRLSTQGGPSTELRQQQLPSEPPAALPGFHSLCCNPTALLSELSFPGSFTVVPLTEGFRPDSRLCLLGLLQFPSLSLSALRLSGRETCPSAPLPSLSPEGSAPRPGKAEAPEAREALQCAAQGSPCCASQMSVFIHLWPGRWCIRKRTCSSALPQSGPGRACVQTQLRC